MSTNKHQQRLFGILATFLVCIMIFVSVSTSAVGAATPTPTNDRYSLVRPTNTPDTREPVVKTMAALNDSSLATMDAQPTHTPGPSKIRLDGKPQFVEFYASWCGPCIAMKPALTRLEKLFGNEVTFWRIDIDNIGSGRLNSKYRVAAIPFMVLLDKDGNRIGSMLGYRAEAQLIVALARLVKHGE